MSAAEERSDEQTPLLEAGRKAAPSHSLTDTEINIVIAAVMLGTCLFAIDGSLVFFLAPSIGSHFGKANLAPALATVYYTASCATTPIWPKTSDIYGRRPLLLLSIGIFALATLACGASPSMGALIVARACAGIGGSGELSLGGTIISDLVSQRRRAKIQGWATMLASVAYATGAPIGGALVSLVGWRGTFLVQIPLVVMVATIYWWKVRVPLPFRDLTLTRRERLAKIDWWGSLTIILATGFVVGALQLGGNFYEWDDPLVIVSLVLGGVFYLVFGLVEGRLASQPLIPLDVLFQRHVLCSTMTSLSQSVAVYALAFQIPVFFMVLADLPTAQAGLNLWPLSIGLASGAMIGGEAVGRTGRYRPFVRVCSLLLLASVALIATTWLPNVNHWRAHDWRYLTSYGLVGFLAALSMPGLLSALISKAEPSTMASHMAIHAFNKMLGPVLGIASSGAIVNSRLKQLLLHRLADRPDARELTDRIRGNVIGIRDLPDDLRRVAIDSLTEAISIVFWFSFALVAVSIFTSLLLPAHHLSDKAPNQAAADSAEEEA